MVTAEDGTVDGLLADVVVVDSMSEYSESTTTSDTAVPSTGLPEEVQTPASRAAVSNISLSHSATALENGTLDCLFCNRLNSAYLLA